MQTEESSSQIILRTLAFTFGVFLLAINYNLFLLPNNLVVGGMSGLAVILQKVIHINATAFIYISSFLLLFVSYIFLGKDKTSNTVIGSILYPIMVSATAPITNFILTYSDLDEYVVVVVLASCLYGIANGIIYKTGYTTGGGDVIMQLLSKYMNVSTSKANFTYSIIIIILSGCTFGIASFIYALIILVISNALINKIIVGVSNSKQFFVRSEKLNEIKDLIKNDFHSNYTILDSSNGKFRRKGEILMIVVPTKSYYVLKNRILEIDPDAFFIINDCYEVNGDTNDNVLNYF